MRNFYEPLLLGENPPDLTSLIIHRKTEQAEFDLLSSHLDLIDIDVQLAGLLQGGTYEILAANSLKNVSCLSKSLLPLSNKYDLVLIDCPPNFNLTVKSALFASDYYIIPTKLDYFSTLGVMTVRENIKSFKNVYSEYMNRLKNSDYNPLAVHLLGVVPMMVNVIKGTELQNIQKEYMNKLREKNFYIFQYVRNNNEMFGTELKDKKGHLKGAVLVSLKPVKDEKTGRINMVPEAGTERTVPARLVLIAAGFLGSEAYVAESFGVERDARTNILTGPGKYSATKEGIYAAGDVHRGQSLVVWAIAEGRAAAREVDKALMGYTNL